MNIRQDSEALFRKLYHDKPVVKLPPYRKKNNIFHDLSHQAVNNRVNNSINSPDSSFLKNLAEYSKNTVSSDIASNSTVHLPNLTHVAIGQSSDPSNRAPVHQYQRDNLHIRPPDETYINNDTKDNHDYIKPIPHRKLSAVVEHHHDGRRRSSIRLEGPSEVHHNIPPNALKLNLSQNQHSKAPSRQNTERLVERVHDHFNRLQEIEEKFYGSEQNEFNSEDYNPYHYAHVETGYDANGHYVGTQGHHHTHHYQEATKSYENFLLHLPHMPRHDNASYQFQQHQLMLEVSYAYYVDSIWI